MLILTRRVGQAIDFSDTRRNEPMGSLVVLALPARNTVRLGFEMEKHIQVLRDDAIRVKKGHEAVARDELYELKEALAETVHALKLYADLRGIEHPQWQQMRVLKVCERYNVKEKAHVAHA